MTNSQCAKKKHDVFGFVPICKYFPANLCARGKSCRFAHVMDMVEDRLEVSSGDSTGRNPNSQARHQFAAERNSGDNGRVEYDGNADHSVTYSELARRSPSLQDASFLRGDYEMEANRRSSTREVVNEAGLDHWNAEFPLSHRTSRIQDASFRARYPAAMETRGSSRGIADEANGDCRTWDEYTLLASHTNMEVGGESPSECKVPWTKLATV